MRGKQDQPRMVYTLQRRLPTLAAADQVLFSPIDHAVQVFVHLPDDVRDLLPGAFLAQELHVLPHILPVIARDSPLLFRNTATQIHQRSWAVPPYRTVS